MTLTKSATGGTVSIAPNDTALVYSPYKWEISATAAESIDQGVYLRLLAKSTSTALTFDTSGGYGSSLKSRIVSGGWVRPHSLTIPSVVAATP